MIAIWKREFKSLFHSVIGWLFVAAILALYGLYFFAYNLNVGYPYISYTLNAKTKLRLKHKTQFFAILFLQLLLILCGSRHPICHKYFYCGI